MPGDAPAVATGRPWQLDLGPGPSVAQVIGRLRSADRPAVLSGQWFGGATMIMEQPLRTVRARTAVQLLDRLDDQPMIARTDRPMIGGGWLACLGYDDDTSVAGFYDHLLRCGPDGRWVVESLGLTGRTAVVEASIRRWRSLLEVAAPPEPYAVGEFGIQTVGDPVDPRLASAQAEHLAGVEATVGLISHGTVYQLNLCTRLTASFEGSPVGLFATLVDRLDPAYGALLPVGDDGWLVSCSPELFVSEHGGRLTAAPIKGTTARSEDPDGSRLAASVKDVAENVMITDLMRNDLSRVCRPGTVTVAELLGLHPHPGVWHLVSTVTGRLAEGQPAASWLARLFPPGSVTGAPKSSAVRGIAALETSARGAYTGALGLFSPLGGTELSVIIRSFEVGDGRAALGVGGGITADSTGISEWRECLHKARPLVHGAGGRFSAALEEEPLLPGPQAEGLIETLSVRSGQVLRLAAHLSRLDRSCREIYGRPAPSGLVERIETVIRGRTDDRLGVRVRLQPRDGDLVVLLTSWALGVAPGSGRLVLGHRPSWPWRHKWADRSVLAAAEETAGRDGAGALPYFCAPGGWVAETSRGNLFCRLADGSWLTPPADDHLLPGVTRRDLLDTLTDLGVRIRLERFGPEVLRTASAVVWTSSLSGVVVVRTIDGHAVPALDDDTVAVLRHRLGFPV